MKENALKRKLERGEMVYGPFMNCKYPSFIEIAGLAGFDFAIVDMEHGPLSVETAEDLCRAGELGGLSPIVRVRKNDAPQIQRALDIGSAGVQIPQIETVEDAKAAVRASKYAPLGMRGVSLFTRAGEYTVNGKEGITDRLNEEQMVVIHIEGIPGLENLEDIVQVPDIDVIFLGPYDLSQSFGIPGQVNDPRVVQGMEEAVAKIRDAGKWAGTFADDATSAQRWADVGVQYISLSVDVGIFGDACKWLLSEARGEA
ncbi:MAG: HpcH/HpaI aldolase family protein [Anaerolineales bacterium]